MITRRHTFHAVAGVLLAAGVLAACGGGGRGDNSGDEVASLDTNASSSTDTSVEGSTPLDPDEAMLAFTECMRDHGVNMPDPQPAGDGGGQVITMEGEEMDRERFEEAQEACEPLMEEVVGEIERDPERDAEMREQMLEYAQCMRDHGVDMPDPTFSDDGRVEIGVGGDGSEIEAEEMDAANEACAGDDMFMAPPSRAGEASAP